MFDLFEEIKEDICLADILSLASIQVDKNDLLPHRVCDFCHDKLINFYQFRKFAVEVDRKLKDILKTKSFISIQELSMPTNLDMKIEFSDVESLEENENSEHSYELLGDVKIENNEDLSSKESEYRNFNEEELEDVTYIDSNSTPKCNICGKSFKRFSTLEKHTCEKFNSDKIQDNNKKLDQNFKCEICASVYKSTHSLAAHMKKHCKKGRILSCSVCNKIFKKVYHLKRHMLCYKHKSPFKCEQCENLFSTEAMLEDHIKIHNSENCNDGSEINFKMSEQCQDTLVKSEIEDTDESKTQIFKCDNCPSIFKSIFSIAAHMKVHNSTKSIMLSCSMCSKIFKKITHLKRHELSHREINTKMSDRCKDPLVKLENVENDENTNQTYKCDGCPSVFKSAHSLAAHMKVHTKKGRILSCSICGKVFKKVSHLKRHELCHEDNRPYKCVLCPRSFGTETIYLEHMNKHNGIKPHKCIICPKAFSNLSTLKAHLKVHTKEKNYLCSTCGKSFVSKSNMRQHLLRHKGLKLFDCSMCPKKFVTKGELKSHSVTHTGERMHCCELCSATFTKGSSLTKHKLIHLGVKPYQCELCKARFLDKNHLIRHFRIHTGEKPYRCEICERVFSQSNDLIKHKRTHLGEKLYKCDQCTSGFRLKSELRRHISEHYVSLNSSNSKDREVEGNPFTNDTVGQESLDVSQNQCEVMISDAVIKES